MPLQTRLAIPESESVTMLAIASVEFAHLWPALAVPHSRPYRCARCEIGRQSALESDSAEPEHVFCVSIIRAFLVEEQKIVKDVLKQQKQKEETKKK